MPQYDVNISSYKDRLETVQVYSPGSESKRIVGAQKHLSAMSENNRAALASKQHRYARHVADVYKPTLSKKKQHQSALRLRGEADAYNKRSPPKIIPYANEPLKVKNESLEKLKERHGVVSDSNRRSIEADLRHRSIDGSPGMSMAA